MAVLALVGALQHRLMVGLQRRLEYMDQLDGGIVRRHRRDDGLPEVALLRPHNLGRSRLLEMEFLNGIVAGRGVSGHINSNLLRLEVVYPRFFPVLQNANHE